MTRLLYPEAFGIMLIVNLVLTALGMLSDVGIRSAIISKREEVSDDFINLAWTISVLRGIALCVITLLAAQPVALWYGEPQLFELLLLASLAPLISGFGSPHPRLAERGVRVTRVVLWQSYTQTIALGVTIAWLLFYPTVWALAANGVISATVSVGLSYMMFKGKPVRLFWDHQQARTLLQFGKWVLLGTALTFFGRQGDSLIVSRFLTLDLLGVFSIAISLAKLVEMLGERLCWGILFPVYSELKHRDRNEFQTQIRKMQLGVYGVCLPVVLVLSCFGRDIINILYDPRYHEAGWMLEVLSWGLGFYVLASSALCLPLAHEDSRHHMRLQLIRVISVLVAMTLGGALYGTVGLVWGIALGQVVYYPFLQISLRQYQLNALPVDLLFAGCTTAVAMATWAVRGWPMPMAL